MGRGYAWLDTGTHESLHHAANFIQTLQERQDLKIGCIEEIAYNQGYIDSFQLRQLAKPMAKSCYGRYVMNLLEDEYKIDTPQLNNGSLIGAVISTVLDQKRV